MKTTLSFDGSGINIPNEYSARVCDFADKAEADRFGPLFAAAPDLLRERDALKVERDALLAALRGMVDAHDQRTRYLGFAAGSRDDDTTHAARAAIARATGGDK